MESGWVRVPKNTLDPPDKYPIIGVGVVTDCKEGLILRFTPQCAYLRYTLLRGPSPGAPSTTTRFSHAYSICVRRSCGALAGLAVQTCAICMAGAGPPSRLGARGEESKDQADDATQPQDGRKQECGVEGEARQRIGDPLHLEPLAEHALRPECGRAIGVSKCCGWCRRAPTGQLLGRAQLGTSPPLTSRVRRAAGCAKGPRAPRGYSRIMVRPASASAHPTLHRWRWLLILNMVPGACGLALASMVPQVSKTYIAYFHQQPRGHPPFIDPPPSTTPLDHPLLKHVPASSTCAVTGVPHVPCLLLLVHRAFDPSGEHGRALCSRRRRLCSRPRISRSSSLN